MFFSKRVLVFALLAALLKLRWSVFDISLQKNFSSVLTRKT